MEKKTQREGQSARRSPPAAKSRPRANFPPIIAGDGSSGHTWTSRNKSARREMDRLRFEPNHARRIDYIFLGLAWAYGKYACVRHCRVELNKPVRGVWPSDHYAVYAEIDVTQGA